MKLNVRVCIYHILIWKKCWFENWIFKNFFLEINQTDCSIKERSHWSEYNILHSHLSEVWNKAIFDILQSVVSTYNIRFIKCLIFTDSWLKFTCMTFWKVGKKSEQIRLCTWSFQVWLVGLVGLWCLMPLSTIF